MYKKSLIWREDNLPPQRDLVAPIYQLDAILSCTERALDGSLVFYFIGAFFDPSVGPVEHYISAIAYALQRMIEMSETGTVTVIVYAAPIQDAPNTPVDRELINQFIKMVTTVFPERLENFVLYPFPWWARAIWTFAAMFLDNRTQNKVHLISIRESFHLQN